MTITIDNVGQSNSAASGTTVVISNFVVGSGSDRYLLVGVSLNNHATEGPTQVDSVTFGVTSLARIDSIANSDDGLVEIWGVVAPANDTRDITVTVDQNPSGSAFVAGAMSFEGVHQATPTRTPWTEATSDVASVTLDITSAVGELVFDTVACEYTPAGIAVGASQTERWGIDVNTTHDINGYGSTEPGASTVTMSWSGDTAHWALGAVSIRPAVAVEEQAAAGAITPAGSLVVKVLKAAAGALTPAGSLVVKALKPVAGALTPAGSLVVKVLKAAAGVIAPAGALATVHTRTQAAAGAITPAGSLVAKTLKSVAGAITPSGSLVRKVSVALAGALTPAGSLARKTLIALSGALTPAGSLARKVLVALAGAITPAGSLARETLKPLAGSITPTGALSTVHTSANEVFHITLEPGDLSEFDSTVDPDNDLSVTGAAALVGSNGLGCLIDDTTVFYGEKTFTQLTSDVYRFRAYIDPNTLSIGSGDRFYFVYVMVGGTNLATAELYYNGSNYQVRCSTRPDSGGWPTTSLYTITDEPHYVEVQVEIGASAGTLTLWIDGVQQEQITAIDNDGLSKPDRARLGITGSVSAGITGTFFIDDFILNDDGAEIGADGLSQAVAGSLTPSGALGPFNIGKALAGSLTPAGALTRKVTASLAGALAPAGSLARQQGKVLGGAIAPAGALSTVYQQALIDAQKILGGIPTFTLTIGSETLTAHLLAYHYEEVSEKMGYLAIWLDNRGDRFDDLANDYPTLTRGAVVTLTRGLVGATAGQALPRCWVESLEYTEDGTLLLTCIDFWGRLEAWRYASNTEFSSQTHSAIAASVLGEVGLTLASGSFGYSTSFIAIKFDDGDMVLQELMAECHEALYAGLAGEVQWKQLDTGEAATYTYDFANGTAEHPLLPESVVLESSPRFNSVAVLGGPDLTYTGTAEDAAEIALTGQTRLLSVENGTLASNAQCVEQAEAMLDHEQAQEVCAILVARPHFTLELYDVVSVAAPPWGGPAVTGRVIELVEDYDIRYDPRRIGEITWEQELTLGSVFAFALEAEGDSGRKSKGRRRARKRSSRRRSSRRRSSSQSRSSSSGSTAEPGLTPIGGIIMWSGASVPAGWALCDGSGGTPDLRDRFIVGSGTTYAIDDTGGAASVDIRHSHGDGSLAAASDSHSHGDGSLAAASDSHSHGDTFSLGASNSNQETEVVGAPTVNLARSGHGHAVNGSVSSDSHGHGVTGSTASDSHGHGVTGSTANALSTTQDILPPYYSLAFIMRIV